MNSCPKCGGLLIEETDEDNFSASQEAIGYYCPGCGWDSNDDPDDDTNDVDNDDGWGPWILHNPDI